jgi:hypothetical protein
VEGVGGIVKARETITMKEWLERKRLVRLVSLLGVYALILVVVAIVSDGPMLGAILVALGAHAALNVPRAVLT